MGRIHSCPMFQSCCMSAWSSSHLASWTLCEACCCCHWQGGNQGCAGRGAGQGLLPTASSSPEHCRRCELKCAGNWKHWGGAGGAATCCCSEVPRHTLHAVAARCQGTRCMLSHRLILVWFWHSRRWLGTCSWGANWFISVTGTAVHVLLQQVNEHSAVQPAHSCAGSDHWQGAVDSAPALLGLRHAHAPRLTLYSINGRRYTVHKTIQQSRAALTSGLIKSDTYSCAPWQL